MAVKTFAQLFIRLSCCDDQLWELYVVVLLYDAKDLATNN